MLRDLLAGIARLTFHKVQPPDIRIVVVDNDDFASAHEVCTTASLPWPLKYVVESKRGISYARNRAVAEAGLVDFIAFIDDDEIPSGQWMDELLSARATFNADVVAGPVMPRYEPEVSSWIKNGGFFEPQSSATGASCKSCATNNVLIAVRVFTSVPRFDDAFALSGAEDTNFFLRVRHAGYQIAWSQEAIVFESVSRNRGTVTWILRREFQTGNGWVFCESDVDGRLRSTVIRFFKACGHIAIGAAAAVWHATILDKAAIVRALRQASLGAGMLTALTGYRFLAYQKVGGIRLTEANPGAA
jgi:glycosyltransferase involved in cell wall biosynthesis